MVWSRNRNCLGFSVERIRSFFFSFSLFNLRKSRNLPPYFGDRKWLSRHISYQRTLFRFLRSDFRSGPGPPFSTKVSISLSNFLPSSCRTRLISSGVRPSCLAILSALAKSFASRVWLSNGISSVSMWGSGFSRIKLEHLDSKRHVRVHNAST